ncbi:MAG TPA: hypothetical protein VGS04_01790, partial [Nitrososphaerales archaeon]|nr:hypothetical protein [Nitrososphaerales archaeon]
MPDLISALALLVAALNVGVFLYGAYWALEIRKALAAPLYKRQSLWVGVIGSLFALFFLVVVGLSVGSVSDVSGNSVATFTVAAFIYVITVMFFVWIDSTMKIARRSDPLRRNTLRWSGLRWFLGF